MNPAHESLVAFLDAVRAARAGDYGSAKELVGRVRASHGEKQAQIARRELWNYIKSDKKC